MGALTRNGPIEHVHIRNIFSKNDYGFKVYKIHLGIMTMNTVNFFKNENNICLWRCINNMHQNVCINFNVILLNYLITKRRFWNSEPVPVFLCRGSWCNRSSLTLLYTQILISCLASKFQLLAWNKFSDFKS